MRRKFQFRFAPNYLASKPAVPIDVPGEIRLPPQAGAVALVHSAQGTDAVVKTVRMLRQDPPLNLKDEIIFLLHTAAEIEHALMAQYLYAAYSLPQSEPHNAWSDLLTGIAREEMGHLLGLQNCLLAIGGPLNFEREDYPFNRLYPFAFHLEPLSISSLARYVLAEMPHPSEIPTSLGFDPKQVKQDAGDIGDGINRVGALYALLLDLIGQLPAGDFYPDSASLQADPQKWKAQENNLIIDKITTIDQMLKIVRDISEQGEGLTEPNSGPPSHFIRLFRLYTSARDYQHNNNTAALSHAVPVDPTVRNTDEAGYIADPSARAWGQLFNHHYRCLLNVLEHQLQVPAGSHKDLLTRWALADMMSLKQIAAVLTNLPQHNPAQFAPDGRPRRAAAPFELPYTLRLPSRPVDLWRYHLMMSASALDLLTPLPLGDTTVARLLSENATRRTQLSAILEQLT